MDPTIWKFLENVTVERNDELSSLYAKAVANIVHVTLQDGRTLTKRVDYPLGNAFNPVSDKQLEGKFNALVVPVARRRRRAKDCGRRLEIWRKRRIRHELMKLAKMPDGERRTIGSEHGRLASAVRTASLFEYRPGLPASFR